MVDFRKLRDSKAKLRPEHPREIFNALPKPPGINDLYASQAEVLDEWFDRRNEKDVVSCTRFLWTRHCRNRNREEQLDG